MNHEKSVLVYAPLGQDASLAAAVLENAGMRAEVVLTPDQLRSRMEANAGALIIAEEALTAESLALLKDRLASQPAWSDLPIILLTSAKGRGIDTQQILDQFAIGGNISLLERPFRTMTLVSVTRVALRSRMKQYQVRALIEGQQKALQQRDDFLSIASHELKTPITSLKLHVQMRQHLLNRGDRSVYQPPKVDSMIKQTGHLVERLSRLVDDMLDVSRIENGKLSLDREVCDLQEIARDVLRTFQSQFDAANSSVKLKAGEPAIGRWDRYRLEQVAANLFTNAIKYGAGRPVEILVNADPKVARLRVRDHGIGIAYADQHRVFERFERAVPNGQIGGLGLGLFISRQIIEMHGGQVLVESEPGKGSMFTVELPRA